VIEDDKKVNYYNVGFNLRGVSRAGLSVVWARHDETARAQTSP